MLVCGFQRELSRIIRTQSAKVSGSFTGQSVFSVRPSGKPIHPRMSENKTSGSKLNTLLISIVMMLVSGGGVIALNVMQKATALGEDVAAIKMQVSGIMPRSEIETVLAGIKADINRTSAENNELRLRLTQLEIAVGKLTK